MPGPGLPCCDLNSDRGHPCHTDPSHAYTDPFGFTYRLCEKHYRALVGTLLRAERTRLTRRFIGLYAPAKRLRPSGPRGRAASSKATAHEQRVARRLAGLSLRQLSELVGYSRSQLQASEHGRRPVSPEVADWVRRVLDESGTVEAEVEGAPVPR
jgi:hypothetical protein